MKYLVRILLSLTACAAGVGIAVLVARGSAPVQPSSSPLAQNSFEPQIAVAETVEKPNTAVTSNEPKSLDKPEDHSSVKSDSATTPQPSETSITVKPAPYQDPYGQQTGNQSFDPAEILSNAPPGVRKMAEEMGQQFLQKLLTNGAGGASDGNSAASSGNAPGVNLEDLLKLPGLNAQQLPATSPGSSQPSSPATPAAAPSAAPAGPTLPDSSQIKIRAIPKGGSPTKNGNSQVPVVEGDDDLEIFVQDKDIREVLSLLSEAGGLNILTSKNVSGNVSASLRGVSIDEALDAILKSTGFVARQEGQFIYVGTPQDFTELQQSLDELGTRVYRPNYTTALELQTLVAPLLTPEVGKTSITTPAQTGIPSDGASAGGDSYSSNEALLVQDYEGVLLQIDQVVAEIDKRPLQVAIEAMILSVKLDDENKFGVDFQLLRDLGTIKFGLGTPPTDLGTVNFNDAGLKFAFLDSSLGSFLTALEAVGETSVITTPRLMALNKQRAEILIGEQLGYVSTTVTETSTAQSVEFLEVGAQLRIRPFISPDGVIRMEIHPELSSGRVDVRGGFTLPEKSVTQVTTNIMVRDGYTIVIGGLMSEELTSTVRQIPFMGNLPVVGPLFRSTTETSERRELLVLVTPRIMNDFETDNEGVEQTGEFHRRHAVFADKTLPWGNRYLARRQFRLAQEAWQKGNKDQALHHVNMAIHIDPTNRAAIDLRSDITHGIHFGEHSSPPGTLLEAAESMLDGPELDPSILERLEQTPAAQKVAPPVSRTGQTPNRQPLPGSRRK